MAAVWHASPKGEAYPSVWPFDEGGRFEPGRSRCYALATLGPGSCPAAWRHQGPVHNFTETHE